MGSKTFGATGTNTVILFLEKFNGPPKRLDLVSDSINSIFASNDLSDWEDEDIIDDYLEKIHVKKPTYFSFIKRDRNYSDWSNDEYFKMYVDAFIASTDFINKTKQKSFSKLSTAERMDWYNNKFYDYVIEIIYVFLTIFLYLPKCPQSLILSALRAFCFCGKPRISRSIFLYFLCQSWLKSW